MSDPENLKSIVEAAASNPKVASAIAIGTTSMGYAGTMDLLHGLIGLVSMIIGCLVGLFVIRIHWIKYKMLKRAWDRNLDSEVDA